MNGEQYSIWQAKLRRGETFRVAASLSGKNLGQERILPAGEQPDPEAEFVQQLTAPAQLVICGGGHVARALAPAAQRVGFQVTVLENRAEVLAEGHFPPDVQLRCGSYSRLLQQGDFSPAAFYAIMTHGHAGDWDCLRAILSLPGSYVGMMGSRKKVAATRAMLTEAGFAPERIDAVHSPIGLAIGAETPEEIAVSIVAELIQCRAALGFTAPQELGLVDGLDKPPYAMVVLTACEGSTPRSPGARMLVFADGSIRGTIGGGVSEGTAKKQALAALKTGKPGLHTYEMNGSAESICGGRVQYLIIPVKEKGFTPC